MASLDSIPGRLPRAGGLGPSLTQGQAERLSALTPVLVAVADSRMRLTFTSPALQRTLGWGGEELAGRNWLELLHAEDLADAGTALGQARQTHGIELTFEARTATRAGDWRWLAWTVAFGEGSFYCAAEDVSERRRAEHALASGDRRLGALIEQVPAIVYTAAFGAEGHWSFVSPQVERMLGWKPDEWTSDPRAWIKSIHPDDHQRVLADEDLLQGPGDQLRSEYRMLARDGRVLWVRDVATVIVGEDGELLMQGLMLDVTDLKQAEGAVLESEQKYRTIVQTSQDMIWAIDMDNRFTFVNDAVKQIHGYDPEEMIGRPFTDFQSPEIARRDLETAAKALDGATYDQYETEHLRKDGTPCLLSFNTATLRDGEGKIIGVTGSARDVTQQRRMEGAVAAKHLQLQSIIDNSPLVIYAKDADHRYVIANHELEAQLSLPAGGAVGRMDDELLAAEAAAQRRAADQRVLDSGRAFEAEEVLTVGDRERAYLLHRFPLRGTDGSVYGVCGIGTDITERREREDTLRAKLEWSLRIRRAIDEDRLVLLRPAHRRDRLRAPGPAGAAGADAGRGRAAHHARRVPAPGRALQPRACDRPLGHRPCRAAGREGPRGGEPLRPERRRRGSSRVHRGAARRGGRRSEQRRVRDHRDGPGARHRPGHAARRAALSARLRLRAGRLRHRLRQLHLPEAPAGGLPEDRHGVRAPPEGRGRRTCRS